MIIENRDTDFQKNQWVQKKGWNGAKPSPHQETL